MIEGTIKYCAKLTCTNEVQNYQEGHFRVTSLYFQWKVYLTSTCLLEPTVYGLNTAWVYNPALVSKEVAIHTNCARAYLSDSLKTKLNFQQK